MSLNRYSAKRDANEPDIVNALRDMGCEVWRLDQPTDLLVLVNGPKGSVAVLLEVKTAKGGVSDEQADFLYRWPTIAKVVRTPHEATQAVLEALGDMASR